MAQREEANLIATALFDVFGTEDKDIHYGAEVVEAREAILEMQEKGGQWRQVEWPAWFLTMKFRELPIEKYGDIFETHDRKMQHLLKGEYIWDLRFNSYNAREAGTVPFMSYENLYQILEEFGGIGLLIANCHVEDDQTGDVYRFQEELKGRSTDYTEEREADPERKEHHRRSRFYIITLHSYFFTPDDFGKGADEGWLGKHFQAVARQQDGGQRTGKPEIYPENIPERCKLDVKRFNHEPWSYEETDDYN